MTHVTRKFNVSESDGATEHEVSIKTPDYASANLAQRNVMWNEGLKSITIKVQGTLRRRIKDGIRDAALAIEAQKAWDSILNGTPRDTTPTVTLDFAVLSLTGMTVEQVKGLAKHLDSQGNNVILQNLPTMAEAERPLSEAN